MVSSLRRASEAQDGREGARFGRNRPRRFAELVGKEPAMTERVHDCSAGDLESSARGPGGRAAMCVFHLIAGLVVAFVAIGGVAIYLAASLG
jgi:hypothetical protein